MSVTYNENNEYSTGKSRYQVLRVVKDTDNGESYLETYNNVKVPEIEGEDVFHIVAHNEVNRLDIIANNYFGDPTYWWAIALANDFIDPFVVNEGEMIRIPSLMALSDISCEILTRRGGSL